MGDIDLNFSRVDQELLDDLDPLVEKPPTPPADELSEEEKAQIITDREAAAKPLRDAEAALVAAVAEYDALGPASTSDAAAVEAVAMARAAVYSAVQAAEDLGINVNRAALIAIGALAGEAEPDVDEVVEPPEPEDDAEPPPVVRKIVDPLVLVPGMVPIYNPLPVPMEIPWGGQRQIVPAQGIGLVAEGGAKIAVGPDNAGGNLSRLGLRRLYGPEPRFAEAIAKSGLTPEKWCKKRNDALIFMADGIGESRANEFMKEIE